MFTATEFNPDSGQVGSVQLEIDLGEDGSNDAQGQGSRLADSWYYDLDVDSSAGASGLFRCDWSSNDLVLY